MSRSSQDGTPSDPYCGFYDEYLSPNTRSALKLLQAESHIIAPTPMELTSKVNTAEGDGLEGAHETMYIDGGIHQQNHMLIQTESSSSPVDTAEARVEAN